MPSGGAEMRRIDASSGRSVRCLAFACETARGLWRVAVVLEADVVYKKFKASEFKQTVPHYVSDLADVRRSLRSTVFQNNSEFF